MEIERIEEVSDELCKMYENISEYLIEIFEDRNQVDLSYFGKIYGYVRDAMEDLGAAIDDLAEAEFIIRRMNGETNV